MTDRINNLHKLLNETIEELREEIREEIRQQIRQENEAYITHLKIEIERYHWIALPDYELMHHQKQEINDAIQQIITGEKA